MAASMPTEKRQFFESLCDLQIPSSIQFSPNAQQIIYATNLEWEHRTGKHPVSTLWLAETGKPGSSHRITFGQCKDHSPRWSPNGGSIAFISDRAEPGKKWAIYLLKFRVDGKPDGEPVSITDPANEREIAGFEFSPDGKKIAYIAAKEKTAEEKTREERGEDADVWGEKWTYSFIWTVDLETKELRQVTGSSVPGIERNVRSFAWSPDSQFIAVVSSKTPHIEEPYSTGTNISILQVPGQTIYDLCSFPNDINDLVWSNDGNLYFHSGVPKNKVSGGRAIYAVKAEFKALHKPKKVAFGVESDALNLRSISGEVVTKVLHGLEDHIYLVSSTSAPRLLYKISQEISTFAAAYSTDSDEIILALATSDINTPMEMYTTTASGGALVQLSAHGSAFSSTSFGNCTTITCPSTDEEVSLDALLLTPPNTPKDKPLPTLVLIHGGPTARVTNSFNTAYYYWAPYLLSQQKFALLLPNYRGSYGKGEAFAAYTTRGTGKYDYEDVIALTDHAIGLGYVDKEHVMVGGVSQGGFLSYLCAVRNGLQNLDWTFKAAIPVSGISDVDSIALTSDLGGTVETEMNGGRAPWNVSIKDTRNRNASALWEFHDAIEKGAEIPPMLIMHGEKDERCPITQAWGMRRALQSRGLPYEFVTYPRQPHDIRERFFWVDMMARIEKWCYKYLDTDGDA